MAAVHAIVHRAYGPPERGLELRQLEPPAPTRSQVLVDVHASTVSEGERRLVQGRPYVSRLVTGIRRPRPRVAGHDFAGRVAAIGPGVTGTRPGDAVYGWCDGAYAEQAVVSVDQLTAMPANLTPAQAAVVPSSGTTALRAVRDAGRVGPGQHVLVIGASGGVGTFAVQIARALGATVTGVCSTTNVDLVRSLGAVRTIDYTLEDLTAARAEFDVIVDLVGDRSLSDLRQALRPRGILVVVGCATARWTAIEGRRASARVLSSFRGQRLRPASTRRTRADLDVLRDLIEAGRLTPVVSAHYPLAEAATALGHFAPGHARGKVAITV